MSELQIGLLAVGVVIVVAILLFNHFQERRFRKQADTALRPPEADPLLGAAPKPAPQVGERVEPDLREPRFDLDVPELASGSDEPLLNLDPQPIARLVADPAPVPRDEAPSVPAEAPRVSVEAPRHTPAPARPPAPAPAAPVIAPPAAYDELIEYRVRIQGDGVLASVFADAFNQLRGIGKQVRWQGLGVGGEWGDVQPWRDGHYQQLLVTLQLADRNGAASEEQLNALCSVLTQVAQTHDLRIACDDKDDALERAQSIDRFCVDVDVLIGLNVVARGEGSINLSRAVREAEAGGMVLGADGVFQLLDSRGEPLYALCNHDAEPFTGELHEGQTSQGVTLQFDVPRVPDGIKVFDGMVTFGRRLANEVGGILVDDNLRPLTDSGIEKIRTQLAQIYERMETRGVPSGSRRALRLFS